MKQQLYCVHDWNQHQHYRDRCPPWIKVHVNVLNSMKFTDLSTKHRGLLMQLWVLASENNGLVNCDIAYLRYRLRCSDITERDIGRLITGGLLGFSESALADASECYSETETETETETEGEENLCSEPLASEPPVILLPTNKSDEEYPVTREQVDEFVNCYPSVDVVVELGKMRGWLIGNRDRRKTYKGMSRFISTWLGRSQDKARASPGRTKTREERIRELEAMR